MRVLILMLFIIAHTFEIGAKPMPVIHSDTLIVESNIFKIDLCNDSMNNETLMIYKNGTVLIKRNDYFPLDLKITDFNGDGFPDLLFILGSGTIYNLFLYDKLTHSFMELENFDNFPEAKRVRKTQYYYSYSHSGCADVNWDSYLFYIKGYKAIPIGNIHAINCKDEVSKGIFIYKYQNGKSVYLHTVKPPKYDKWQFIEHYWSRHFNDFVH